MLLLNNSPTPILRIDPALQHFINQHRTTQELPQTLIALPINKHTSHTISTLGYNQLLFHNLLDRALDNPKFKEKFIEIHNNITLDLLQKS